MTYAYAQRAGAPPEQAGVSQGGGAGAPGGMPPMNGTKIANPAIYMKDGAYLPQDSATTAVSGGKVGDPD